MRRTLLLTLAASFALACGDAPSSSLLEPQLASLSRAPVPDYPPPPFAIMDGSVSSEYGTFNFTAKFFANKPGNQAWLQFESTTTAGVSFSANARIMSVNGKVSGTGTISVDGNTIRLSEIDTFNYQSYRTTGTVSFSGGSIRQGGAFGRDFGGGGVCTEVCVIDGGH